MATLVYETTRFAFYEMRVGASIVRKRDNASVYFQPGDDTSHAVQDVCDCIAGEEMYKGERGNVFNEWCSNYMLDVKTRKD